jgi:hypothetical protein
MIPPSERAGWPTHLKAFCIYTALAALLIWHFEPLTKKLEGIGTDPIDCMWFLDWWPWAISHHMNPLHAALVWQPLGVYLAWITGVPLLSFLGLPLTLLGGPAMTYNIFSITAPVGAAFTAYLLCLRVSGRPAAATLGGFLFGFSSYVMTEELATLDLSVVLLVPLMLLLVLKRLDDEVGRLAFALWGALLLSCQFLIGMEVAASSLVFGGIAWLFALLYMPPRRKLLVRLVVDALAAAPLVVLAVSPFLISMARHPHVVKHPAFWPYYFTVDLASLVLPTPMIALGGAAFAGLSGHFSGIAQERGGYIGLPLLAIAWSYARQAGRTAQGRLLIVCFGVFVLLSLGPQLWVCGYITALPAPWVLFVHLPLLGDALPARFALYSALALALITSLWLASAPPGKAATPRWALAALACLFLLPRPHPWFAVPQAAFFEPGRVQAVLGPNPRLLVLPLTDGPSAWQVESRFSFSETGGYLGYPPAQMQHYRAVLPLFSNYQDPSFLDDLSVFCAGTHTQYVVAGPGTSAALISALGRLNWPARRVDDVIIFTVPNSVGAAHAG